MNYYLKGNQANIIFTFMFLADIASKREIAVAGERVNLPTQGS